MSYGLSVFSQNGTKVFIITHSKKQSKKLKAQEIFIESGAVLY